MRWRLVIAIVGGGVHHSICSDEVIAADDVIEQVSVRDIAMSSGHDHASAGDGAPPTVAAPGGQGPPTDSCGQKVPIAGRTVGRLGVKWG